MAAPTMDRNASADYVSALAALLPDGMTVAAAPMGAWVTTAARGRADAIRRVRAALAGRLGYRVGGGHAWEGAWRIRVRPAPLPAGHVAGSDAPGYTGPCRTSGAPWHTIWTWRVRCPDGVIRRTLRSGAADTWFSVPASVRVGRRVWTGYITTADDGAAEFRPHVVAAQRHAQPFPGTGPRRA